MPPFDDKLAEAHRLIETANPMEVANLKAYLAVAGVPLQEQKVTPPSLGGLVPDQMEQVQRQQKSVERAHEADIAARARWVDSQEAKIRDLTAGQAPNNQDQIRRSFRAMKGS